MQKETAVVTGASSGIGREMAKLLSERGYHLVLAARRKERLVELQGELAGTSDIFTADLSKMEDCQALHAYTAGKNVSVLINNAGFGAYGSFQEIPLEKELQMIDVNIKAVHILTKLFLEDFRKKDKGHLLNVASVAGLMPAGPYMASYYASKAYVTSLTLGLAQELKDEKSKVYIGALCPGPVDTEFNEVAEVSFGLNSISAKTCAQYGIKQMYKGKTLIVPGRMIRLASSSAKLAPRKWAVALAGRQQRKKAGK